jgi:hypothetical protein
MMSKLPTMLRSGEPSRLFPVLAETSKEGRTLSIFLACLENVSEFGRSMLGGLEVRIGSRARIDTFTEVGLNKTDADAKHRPDGLIVVNTGKSTWTALVEAKVGTAELTNSQIEAYLKLAKLNGIDAVITVSNQFTSLPTHHPLAISSTLTRKVALFHWSWGYVITQAQLLREMGDVEDREQLILLAELQRFLLHPSSGVKEFDQMSAEWPEICNTVSSGGNLSSKNPSCQEVGASWHQALDLVASVLSRQLGDHVKVLMTKAEASDPLLRLQNAMVHLIKDGTLLSQINVPDTAGPVQVTADIKRRTLTLAIRLKAPADRKSTKARLSWLLRQLSEADAKDIHVRMYWPGRSTSTQHTLSSLRENPEIASNDRDGMSVSSFEIFLTRELGAKFAQRKNFVTELVRASSEFYANVGAYLTTWQAKPPRISDGKQQPSSVSTEAMRDIVEQEALDRTS